MIDELVVDATLARICCAVASPVIEDVAIAPIEDITVASAGTPLNDELVVGADEFNIVASEIDPVTEDAVFGAMLVNIW